MKTNGERRNRKQSEGIVPQLMTSALDRDGSSASRPGRFTAGEGSLVLIDKRLGGPWSWSGSSGWSERCGEEKNLAPAGNRTSAVQPVTRRYTC
jgi:hypothetical protein